MQNNVTELTQRLLRSLDNNYNVVDMPAVIEIISLLEKVAITKELLETTRLGKHVNELRRKTTNESLSKRAKELVKKWRNMVLPESNGQLKPAPPPIPQEDVNLNQLKPMAKKRPAKETLDVPNLAPKRPKINGQISELDFSDNSNSSFKDVINSNVDKSGVILINSDSNSSVPESRQDPHLEQPLPKKRGRKKGSKNHKNLLDEAETSFCNKLAVSRGNSKVKTTQELIASLQNKNSLGGSPVTAKSREDLNERAAKLTERVSIIDQKLNSNSTRYKNSHRKNSIQKISLDKSDKVIECGSVINDKSLVNSQANSSATDEEIIVVDDIDVKVEPADTKLEKVETEEVKSETTEAPPSVPLSLSESEALALLPPLDLSVLDEVEEETRCSCILKENKTDFSVEEDSELDLENRFEFIEDHSCQAKSFYNEKYHLGYVSEEKVRQLSSAFIPNVNGNFSVGPAKIDPKPDERGLYYNVVPNLNTECILKDERGFDGENFKKYSISETGGGDDGERTEDTLSDKRFREWHEVVDTPSYNGEILKILPYVIID